MDLALPASVVSSACTVVISFLIKRSADISSELLSLTVRVTALEAAKIDPERLVAVEVLVKEQKEDIGKLDQTCAAILNRLELLPKIAAQLESLKERLDRLEARRTGN